MPPVTYKYKNPYAMSQAKGTSFDPYDVLGNAAYGSDVSVQQPGRQPGQSANAYKDLINQMLGQQRADIGAEGVADAASRDAQLRRILVSYGAIPEMAGIGGESQGYLQGVLDPETRALIEKNTAEGTSVKARLDQANQIAQRQLVSRGGKAGTLHSGQTVYDEQQQALQNKQTQFDTLSEALGNIEGTVGSYAANERQRQRQLAEYEMQAQMSAAQFADDTDMTYGPEGPVDQYGLSTNYDQYSQSAADAAQRAQRQDAQRLFAQQERARAAARKRAAAERAARLARSGNPMHRR
jgi:hypothetical protein